MLVIKEYIVSSLNEVAQQINAGVGKCEDAARAAEASVSLLDEAFDLLHRAVGQSGRVDIQYLSGRVLEAKMAIDVAKGVVQNVATEAGSYRVQM